MASDTESIWEIIKDGCKKCFKAETSTEAGRLNLLGGLICAVFILTLITTDIIDKILWCINNKYEIGLPWYAILVLIGMFLLYCSYCINKLIKINKLDE